DVPLHRSTANLGAAPVGMNTLRTGSLRTGSPLSASVTGRPRRFPYWQLALSALALLMVALVTVAFWRMPHGPYAEVLGAPGASPGSSAATATLHPVLVPAAASPVEALPTVAASAAPAPPQHPTGDEQPVAVADARPRATASGAESSNAREPAAPKPAPHAAVASKPVPSPSRPAPVKRVVEDDTEAPRRAPPPPPAPEAEATLPEAPVPSDADEVVFPVRTPAPSRPAPVLGANQSPILD
ncbi:MAG TPA: hypothetical protein VMG12_07645, partial [Polyangiaceae bacterium]|nr:hypothetical protein [Polyangiaceae bacterium]